MADSAHSPSRRPRGAGRTARRRAERGDHSIDAADVVRPTGTPRRGPSRCGDTSHRRRQQRGDGERGAHRQARSAWPRTPRRHAAARRARRSGRPGTRCTSSRAPPRPRRAVRGRALQHPAPAPLAGRVHRRPARSGRVCDRPPEDRTGQPAGSGNRFTSIAAASGTGRPSSQASSIVVDDLGCFLLHPVRHVGQEPQRQVGDVVVGAVGGLLRRGRCPRDPTPSASASRSRGAPRRPSAGPRGTRPGSS